MDSFYKFVIDLLRLIKPNHNYWIVSVLLITGLGMLSQPWWVPFLNMVLGEDFAVNQSIELTGWGLVVLSILVHIYHKKAEKSLVVSENKEPTIAKEHSRKFSEKQFDAFVDLFEALTPQDQTSNFSEVTISDHNERTMWGAEDEWELEKWGATFRLAKASYQKQLLMLSEKDDMLIRGLVNDLSAVCHCLIKKRAYAWQLPPFQELFADTHGAQKYKNLRNAYLEWDDELTDAKNKYSAGMREFRNRYHDLFTNS